MRRKPNKLEKTAEKPRYKIVKIPDLNIDYDSGAELIDTSSHLILEGTKAFYHLIGHTITRPLMHKYDLHGTRINVDAHESGHARGILHGNYEARADAYAASKTGHNPMPFRTAA